MKLIIFKILLLIAFVCNTNANNLTISNVTLPSTSQIRFELQWDNSWYANSPTNNWDAVWIFVKTQVCGTGTSPWLHGDVRTQANQHDITGTILEINPSSDNKGVFIRRSALGGGNISSTTVTLKFQNTYTLANTNFQVFGIEMVHIPSAAFSVGDGSTSSTMSTNAMGANGSSPYTISTENAIGQDALRNDNASSGSITAHNSIPAAFPKGFNSFYVMKYEISQKQYAAFLNSLDYNQQANRMGVSPSSAVGTPIFSSGENRNSLEITSPGTAFSVPATVGNDLNNNNVFNESIDGGSVACNFLSWDDLKAYLDWAALRPMTELEFEKVSRGINTPVQSGYVWGSTVINQASSASITNSGAASEASTSTADGLAAYGAGSSTTLGPLRIGFAATSSTTRSGAASGYYGVFNLGDNLWEQTFSIGWFNGTSRVNTPTFTGVLGDGLLDANGNADATNWGAVAFSIVKGGNWEYSAQRCQTSDRFYLGNTSENSTRTRRTGGRGVR